MLLFERCSCFRRTRDVHSCHSFPVTEILVTNQVCFGSYVDHLIREVSSDIIRAPLMFSIIQRCSLLCQVVYLSESMKNRLHKHHIAMHISKTNSYFSLGWYTNCFQDGSIYGIVCSMYGNMYATKLVFEQFQRCVYNHNCYRFSSYVNLLSLLMCR